MAKLTRDEKIKRLPVPQLIGLRGEGALKSRGYSKKEITDTLSKLVRKGLSNNMKNAREGKR